jgi:hypothetical protein
MSNRRILAIGSQFKALGRLDFLPQTARDFYSVMTDSNRGGCVSALDAGAASQSFPSREASGCVASRADRLVVAV